MQHIIIIMIFLTFQFHIFLKKFVLLFWALFNDQTDLRVKVTLTQPITLSSMVNQPHMLNQNCESSVPFDPSMVSRIMAKCNMCMQHVMIQLSKVVNIKVETHHNHAWLLRISMLWCQRFVRLHITTYITFKPQFH